MTNLMLPSLSGLCSLTKWDLSDCNLPVKGGEILSDSCLLCLLFKNEPEYELF